MFGQQSHTTDDEVRDEHSMRIVEWVLALAAAVAAGVLALIR